MLLSTPAYFAFLVAIFFAYWLAARYRLGALAVVIFANYFFYARWDLIYLALIPLASTCDFFIGRALHGAERPLARRALITASVLLNVSLIVSVKYSPSLPWTLPLSLSFYAFQSLTYTLDIYRRDAQPATSYLAYLASASFFPTTLAGPITRLTTLIPQWSKSEILSAENGGRALFLIGLGLLKKFFIADYLADNLINRVFDLPKLYSGTEVPGGGAPHRDRRARRRCRSRDRCGYPIPCSGGGRSPRASAREPRSRLLLPLHGFDEPLADRDGVRIGDALQAEPRDQRLGASVLRDGHHPDIIEPLELAVRPRAPEDAQRRPAVVRGTRQKILVASLLRVPFTIPGQAAKQRQLVLLRHERREL